jgi:hypothetical protein
VCYEGGSRYDNTKNLKCINANSNENTYFVQQVLGFGNMDVESG